MVKKKVSKKKANKSSNNFNRNLLIGAVIIILIFVVAFNFAGKGSDEEGLAQSPPVGGEDEKNVYGKPFENIEKFYDICSLYKMPYVGRSGLFDCDDFALGAAFCAIAMGYNACMIWERGRHYINVIEVESDKEDEIKFCVVEPQQNGGIRTSQTGCPSGCWYQGKDEKEPSESDAGNCLKNNEEIICDHSEMIWHATDPYCSLQNPQFCQLMEEKDICIDKIKKLQEETEPYDPSVSGGTSPETPPPETPPSRERIGILRKLLGRGR